MLLIDSFAGIGINKIYALAYCIVVVIATVEDDGVGHNIKFRDTDEWEISLTMCRDSLLDAIGHFEGVRSRKGCRGVRRRSIISTSVKDILKSGWPGGYFIDCISSSGIQVVSYDYILVKRILKNHI